MSLRLRAVLITGIALMVLWATAAAWMMQGMRANLDRTLDGRLAMSARMVAGLLEGATLDPTASPVNFTEAVRISGKEEAQASLAGAEEGVRRLRRILDQMMTLARTEAVISRGDECTSVLEGVHGVLNQVSEAQRSRLALTVAGADTGTPMPRSMLETALRNLVNNALRYSPDCATIEGTASFDHSAQRCVLSVADQGPGLSPEQVSQMGRRFWRGDQGRGHQDGAGLGISIVRAITARFGGALDLKPRAEGGLIAEVMTPLSSATKT